MKNKYSILTILILVVSILMIGCQKENKLAIDAMEQGKLAMAEEEYSKALASFQLSIQEGLKDQDGEIKALIEILKDYEEALNLYDDEKLEESKSILEEMDESYKEYNIKKNIDELLEDIDNILDLKEKYIGIEDKIENNQLDDARRLITEADEIFEEIDSTEEIKQLRDKVKKMIKEIEDNEDEQLENIGEAENIPEGSTELTVEEAVEILFKEIGESREEYGYRHYSDMDEYIDGVRWYTIDTYHLSGQGAANAYSVSSKDGSVNPLY